MDTIVAHCTPSGKGAIALIRISGAKARNIVEKYAHLSSEKKISSVPSHTIHHGQFVCKNRLIDDVLFLIMDGPKTFTGEHTIEITCHNNPFIINAIIEQLISGGARTAAKGEFTRQAFLNEKIDLPQAEAIHELISASSQQALKMALAQLHGSLSHTCADLEKKTIELISVAEASFEFLEEEVDFSIPFKKKFHVLLNRVQQLQKTHCTQKQIRSGMRIVLLGSVNAGKSSLFNKLIDTDRAIVSHTAGTTRDTIEAGIYKKGLYWTFVDTAGIRTKTNNTIEQEGIRRSCKEAQKADIIILIYDRSKSFTHNEKKFYETCQKKYTEKIIPIYTKSDLPAINTPFQLPYHVSTKTGIGIKPLLKGIEQKIAERLTQSSVPFLLNQRHMMLLCEFEQELTRCAPLMDNVIEYELISYHLKQALVQLSELTGKSIDECVLETIFKSFCIGK